MISPPTLSTLSTIYEQYIRRPTDKPRTVEAYRDALANWERLAGSPPLSAIDNSQLSAFISQLSNEGKAPATVNKIRRHVLAVLNRSQPAQKGNPGGLGLIDRNLFVSPLPEAPPEPRRVTDEQIAAVYRSTSIATWPFYSSAEPGPDAPQWWRALIVLLWNTGIRRNDLFSLCWSAVDLQAGRLTWIASKTGKRQTVPLVSVVRDHLVAIKTRSPLVFPTYPGAGLHGEPVNVDRFKSSLYRTWKAIQRDAGISERFTFKQLRETAGSNFYAISPGAAQELLGHSDIRTTRRHYAELSAALANTSAAIDQPAAFSQGPDDEPPAVIRFPTAG